MIENKKRHEIPDGDGVSPFAATARDLQPRPAPASTAVLAGSQPTMLGAVREMLALAIEGAFDLRTGREQSRHLQRFEEMLAEQKEVLNSLDHGEFSSDPGLLTRRAMETLHGFAAAVRHEIVEEVHPGMCPTVFDAALQRLTDRAVMAGAAFASLDLALEQI